jgi:hypothetical protein
MRESGEGQELNSRGPSVVCERPDQWSLLRRPARRRTAAKGGLGQGQWPVLRRSAPLNYGWIWYTCACWRCGRAVECTGLENRRGGNLSVSSNLTASASTYHCFITTCPWLQGSPQTAPASFLRSPAALSWVASRVELDHSFFPQMQCIKCTIFGHSARPVSKSIT